MNFLRAVDIILKLENGYNLDPRDPGGATKFGISKKSYASLDIENLTREAAIDIYKKDYWDKYLIEKLPDFFRLTFFDCCVNQGGPTAVRILQLILTVKVDGVIGQQTIDRMSVFSAGKVLNDFTMARCQRYINDPNYSKFGAGWLKRLLEITLQGAD